MVNGAVEVVRNMLVGAGTTDTPFKRNKGRCFIIVSSELKYFDDRKMQVVQVKVWMNTSKKIDY